MNHARSEVHHSTGRYPGGVLAMDHYDAARAEFEVARNTLFRSRWAQATTAEQKLIIAMASLSDGDVKRKEVAEAMGVTSTAISMARQSLMDKGLIEATSHGKMRFTAPGLAEYIREYVADEE